MRFGAPSDDSEGDLGGHKLSGKGETIADFLIKAVLTRFKILRIYQDLIEWGNLSRREFVASAT